VRAPTLETIESGVPFDLHARKFEVARALETAFSPSVNDAMHTLPADPVAFVLTHSSLASFVLPPTRASEAAVAGESAEAGRARVMGILEPRLSQAIDAVLLDLPGDPTAAVLQQLHKAHSRVSLQ